MRAIQISAALKDIPVDFLGDPDGCWDYDQLGRVAGFDQAWGKLSIGALTEPYGGFPDGAAVVLLISTEQCRIALVDCLSDQDGRAQVRNDGWGSSLALSLGSAATLLDRHPRDVAA